MLELNWNDLWKESEQRYRVQLRNGWPVHVITLNGRNPQYPVVGEFRGEAAWVVCSWTLAGQRQRNVTGELDLIPESRIVRRWGPVVRPFDGAPQVLVMVETEQEAYRKWHNHPIAYVEWEDYIALADNNGGES